MRDYNKLITDLDAWENHNGCHIGADGWLQGSGSFNLAVAFSSLFWPEFEIYKDSVLQGPVTELQQSNFQAFSQETTDDIASTEVTLNHRHIVDLFPNEDGNPTRDQILFLGRTLKAMWEAKLRLDFPDRTFVVSFPEDYSEDLTDYEITFWEERPPKNNSG